MAEASGLLRVVSPDQLAASEQAEISRKTAVDSTRQAENFSSELARYIHNKFERARNHRQTEGIDARLLNALRAYKGEYPPDKLREIRKFEGSEVYSRMVAAKCRGASALLRDIYLAAERPWGIEPTPVPAVPAEILESIQTIVQAETATLQQYGQQIDPAAVTQRSKQLMDMATKAEKKHAVEEARKAEAALDDILWEGEFYNALGDFLLDLPIFPYAILKGPVVRMVSQVRWQPGGELLQEEVPKLFWYRVSPFDMWFSPAAANIRQTDIHERIRLTYAELHSLIGVSGYDEEAIRRVLENAKNKSPTFSQWAGYFEAERADLESRQNPFFDGDDNLIDAMEFTGYIRGELLIDWGMTADDIADKQKAYFVTAWLIDRDVIKVQMVPAPRQRPPVYVTSFERMPGSLTGNGLPDILSDISDVSNATLRALVNNLSIASGPQVIIDEDRLSPNTNGASLYPWKRWFVTNDALSNNVQRPVDFYQPNSNSNELLTVYEKFNQMADEVSAIPRYMTGSERVGGAGRTASGLAMLMNNSSKVMQSVAGNIDDDVLEPLLENLYDMVMLTDEGATLRGDENIIVRGVVTAIQQEQDRVRQLEFLQMTGNPIDSALIGPKGRAAVLRSVARNLGLDHEAIVPSDDDIDAQMQAEQQAAAMAPPEEGEQPAGSEQQPGPDETQTSSAPPHLNTQANARRSGV